MIRGFIGECETDAKKWLRNEFEWNAKMGKKAVVVYKNISHAGCVYSKFVKSCVVVPECGATTGFARKFDPALETMVLSKSMREASKRFSDIVVTDADIAKVRESFWPQATRSVVENLFEASVYYWMEKRNSDKSLFGVLCDMMLDFSAAKMSMPGKTTSGFVAPEWWRHLSEDSRKALNGIIVGNAQQTAGCIFAEASGRIGAVERFSSKERSLSVFRGDEQIDVLYVPVSSISPKGVETILELCYSAWKDSFIIVFPNVSGFSPEHREIIGNFTALYEDPLVLWTSSNGDIPARLVSETIFFGKSGNEKNLSVFRFKVRDTLGTESGLVTNLPYETPANLPDDAMFLLSDGKWSIIEIPSALPVEIPDVFLSLGNMERIERKSDESFVALVDSALRNVDAPDAPAEKVEEDSEKNDKNDATKSGKDTVIPAMGSSGGKSLLDHFRSGFGSDESIEIDEQIDDMVDDIIEEFSLLDEDKEGTKTEEPLRKATNAKTPHKTQRVRKTGKNGSAEKKSDEPKEN